jgi:hypothetical protein
MKKNIIIIIIGLVAVIGSFFGGYKFNSYLANNQATKATDAAGIYIEGLLKGNWDQAYNATTDALRKQVSLDKFKSENQNAAIPNPVFLSTYTSKIGDGYVVYATIDGYPKTSDGRTTALYSVSVVNENGKFKVDTATVQ